MSFNVKNLVTIQSAKRKIRRELIRNALFENRLTKKSLQLISEQVVGSEITGTVPGARYRINSIDPANVGNSMIQVLSYPPAPKMVGKVFPLQNTIDRWGEDHPVAVAIINAAANIAAEPGLESEEDQIPEDDPEIANIQFQKQSPEDMALEPDVVTDDEVPLDLPPRIVPVAVRYESDAFKDLVGLTITLTEPEAQALASIADRISDVDYVDINTEGQERAVNAINFILDKVSLPGTGIPEPDPYSAGVFGRNTADAVKAFQTYVGFTGRDVDGIVGKNTASALLGREPSSWQQSSTSRRDIPVAWGDEPREPVTGDIPDDSEVFYLAEDRLYEYQKIGGIWYMRRSGDREWSDISDNQSAVARLEAPGVLTLKPGPGDQEDPMLRLGPDGLPPRLTSGRYPVDNIRLVESHMDRAGVTNTYARIAILSVMAKESSLVPKRERCYDNTSNGRIRDIFGARVRMFDEEELTELKSSCTNFFNHVYGPRFYGPNHDPGYSRGAWADHTDPDDGYNYRGRGFNQITFKSNYREKGELAGVDLVSNPDLMLDPDIAGKVGVAFLVDGAKKRFGGRLPDFYSQEEANRVFARVNAGWNKRSVRALTRATENTDEASRRFALA
jgi:predicted chitinase